MLFFNFLSIDPFKHLAAIVNLLVETHLAAPAPAPTPAPIPTSTFLFKHSPTSPPIASFISTETPLSSPLSPLSSVIPIFFFIFFNFFVLVYMGHTIYCQYKRLTFLETAAPVYQNNFDLLTHWARHTGENIVLLGDNYKKQQANFMANFESIASHSQQINTALDMIEEATKENEIKLRAARMRAEELEKARVLEREMREQRMEEQLAEMRQAMQTETKKILDEHRVASMKARKEFDAATKKTQHEIDIARKQDREEFDLATKKIQQDIDIGRKSDQKQNEAARTQDREDVLKKVRREIDFLRQRDRDENQATRTKDREEFDEVTKKTQHEITMARDQVREEFDAAMKQSRQEISTVQRKDRREFDAAMKQSRQEISMTQTKDREEFDAAMKQSRQEISMAQRKDREELGAAVEVARNKDREQFDAAMKKIRQDVDMARRKDREEIDAARNSDQEEMTTKVEIFQVALRAEEETRHVAERRAEESNINREAAERRADQLSTDFEALKLVTQKLIDDARTETLAKLETTSNMLKASNQTLINDIQVEILQRVGQSEKDHEIAIKELNDIQKGLAQKLDQSEKARKHADDEGRALIQALQTAAGDAEKRHDEHSALLALLTKKGETQEAELRASIVIEHERLASVMKDLEQDRAKLAIELRRENRRMVMDHAKRDSEQTKIIEEMKADSVNHNAKHTQDITRLRSDSALNHQRLLEAIEFAVERDRGLWVEKRMKDEETWMMQRKKDQVEMRRMRSEVNKGLIAAVQHKTKTSLRLSKQFDTNRDLRVLVHELSKNVRECRRTLADIGEERQDRPTKVNAVKYSGLPTPSPSQSPSLEIKRRKVSTTYFASESPLPLGVDCDAKPTNVDHGLSISIDSLDLKTEENSVLPNSSINYGLWETVEKEKLLALHIPDTSSNVIPGSPAVSDLSISIPALPSVNDLFLTSASPYGSELSLYYSSDSSDVSMGKYLPPLSQESIIAPDVTDEVSAVRPTFSLPSCDDMSLGKPSSFPLSLVDRDVPFCPTPTSEAHFAINVFPPPTASPPLSPSPSSASAPTWAGRSTPKILLPDTIAGIGDESWTLAHQAFCPLASSGLERPLATVPQTGNKINVSFEIKVEEETFLLDDVSGFLPTEPSVSEALSLEPEVTGISVTDKDLRVTDRSPLVTKVNTLNPPHEKERLSWLSTDDELYWSCVDGSKGSPSGSRTRMATNT